MRTGLLLLAVRNVAAKPGRSALLCAFVALSIFLAVFLRSVLTTLDDVVSGASPRRLTVTSGVGLLAELPASYEEAVREVPGVVEVTKSSWFGAFFRDASEPVPSLAVDLEAFLRSYPEVLVAEPERLALLADRTGCLVGRRLADRHGLRVGDPLPLFGTAHPRPGGLAWTFTVRAVYRSADPAFPETAHLFHWKHFDDVRRDLDLQDAATVSVFLVEIDPARAAVAAAEAIDARFARGPVRTHTQTEQAHRAEEVALLGDLPAYLRVVAAAALVAMMLLVGNAMGIAARARATQVGILKALGHPDSVGARLVLLESLVLVGIGGLAGIGAAAASQGTWRRILGDTLSSYAVRADTFLLAALAVVATAILGAAVPAVRLLRARPMEVLRHEA